MTKQKPQLNNGIQLDEFIKLAKKERIVSNWLEVVTDLDTPVSIYSKLSKHSKDSFLLESVEGGEKLGRYSIIGFKSLKKISSQEGTDSYEALAKELEEYQSLDCSNEDLPFFHKGFVGYLSFETVKDIEHKLKDQFKKSRLPEMHMVLVGSLAVFDHVKHKLYLISNQIVESDDDASLSKLYEKSEEEINELMRIIRETHQLENIHIDYNPSLNSSEPAQSLPEGFSSNTSKEEFITMVEKAKNYILEGDIFQVVLSHIMSSKIKVDPLLAYRFLRAVNPSPYLFLVNCEDGKKPFSLVGSSPEMLVKNNKIGDNEFLAELRPIAGTYRRGKDEQEDQELSEKLLSDKKEIAEHVMLVDLARNDLGRVCENSSITVPQKMIIERYSHVLHIVSSVTGKLKDNETCLSLLKACFPAGTLSGAPKIRALEIIAELEKEARGPYGGCVCYIGLDGSLNNAMTIRTMVIEEDQVSVQAGAGVVADSKPESEYQETLNKAGALIRVIDLVKKS